MLFILARESHNLFNLPVELLFLIFVFVILKVVWISYWVLLRLLLLLVYFIFKLKKKRKLGQAIITFDNKIREREGETDKQKTDK